MYMQFGLWTQKHVRRLVESIEFQTVRAFFVIFVVSCRTGLQKGQVTVCTCTGSGNCGGRPSPAGTRHPLRNIENFPRSALLGRVRPPAGGGPVRLDRRETIDRSSIENPYCVAGVGLSPNIRNKKHQHRPHSLHTSTVLYINCMGGPSQ